MISELNKGILVPESIGQELRLQAAALESAANAIVIVDLSGAVVWANPAFSRLTGFALEEVLGEDLRLLKSGQQPPEFYKELWETILSGQVWQGQLINRRRDGRFYNEEMTITPVRDEQGIVTHFVAVKQDVTERRRAEENLQDLYRLFRSLMQNALDIVTIVDGDGMIRYGSPSIERVLGYTPSELVGRSAFDFMPEEDARKVAELIARSDEKPGYAASLEFRFRHKDGSWHVLEGVAKDMRKDSIVAGIVVNSRDVTQRKQVEDELQQQREARYQSEKLADMGTLLAGVAHELNNPLAVVMGYSAMLQEALADGPQARRAGKIVKAADRCVRIVRNFLALARHHRPERKEVRLNQVVEEAVELLAYPLRVDDVNVTLRLAPELPVLWADPHQLHQVVVNLITNAHQAMRAAAPPRRLVLTTTVDADGGTVALEVADTGPGIPTEIRARIFEPFFTTKPEGQGTGLGLPLCQGIVESHGGTIRVESEPGHGAAFTIEIPIVAPPAAEAAAPDSDAIVVKRGAKILVVDDEPEVGRLLADVLAVDGYEVDSASDGAAALEKLEECDYDLILSDLRMPRLDGRGLYREVEQRCPALLSRFVFLTGDTLSQETRTFLEQVMAPALNKPFDFSQVRAVVARALQGR
ncbi:MAG TPA: PAS domain S-box protein [Methylomirabilota bacterium]|nr:PAS domain S-box protein [Methylomirabilota bacterium]